MFKFCQTKPVLTVLKIRSKYLYFQKKGNVKTMSDHSDSSHSSHPSVSPSHSSNHSDHSMGDWSPQPFHSPLHISLSTPSVSLERYRSSSPRFSLRSSSPSPVHIQGVPKKRGIKNFNFLTHYLGLQTVLRKVFVLKIKLRAFTF